MSRDLEVAEGMMPARPARLALGIGPASLAAGLLIVGLARRNEPGKVIDAPQLVVGLNTAPRPVLEALPRIGPVLAGSIERARDEAPFTSLDDLRSRVARIGPVTAASLFPHVRFDHDAGPATGEDRPPTAPSGD